VSKKGSRLPPDVIKHWPEVFEDIDVKAVPVEYIDSIQVYFDDGTVWEIDIDEKEITENSPDIVEESLGAFFEEYDDVIENVDFRLNTKKVIRDIKSRSQQFLKKRK